MANDAYQLQGRDGWDIVGPGQSFTGRSRGAQVVEDADVVFTNRSPKNEVKAVSLSAAPAGLFVGGTITVVDVTTGQVLVYPDSADYTIA